MKEKKCKWIEIKKEYGGEATEYISKTECGYEFFYDNFIDGEPFAYCPYCSGLIIT